MQTKICSKCHKEKELYEFYKQKHGKYGRESICILCKKSPQARKDFLVPNGFKLCPLCNKEKPLTDFYKDNNVKSCTGPICKICDKIKYKESRKINRKNNKKQIQNKALQTLYGITLSDYNRMFEEQSGVCAICGKEEIQKNQFGTIRLSVDHDHQTGKVRGLLCSKCNRAIGLLNDDFKILNKAAKYLKKYQEL